MYDMPIAAKIGRIIKDMLEKIKERTKEQIQYLINNSQILFIDPEKKRTDSWLASLRVQFPSDVTEYGSKNKITYADEVFNTN